MGWYIFCNIIEGSKGGKSPKPQKTPKQGKQKTIWDPFTFGGDGARGQEAADLNYFNRNNVKNGVAGKDTETGAPTDHQLEQFVPDRNVIGKSAELGGNITIRNDFRGFWF